MIKELKCRHCGAPLSLTLVDLGLSPLANSYIPPERSERPEPRYPLHARVCENCFLVQVDDAVPRDEIFSENYAYFSSFSDAWLKHCKQYVNEVASRFSLGSDDLVMEIASNDGYLLQYFLQKGIAVLGVEPAANVAAVAETKGVTTRVDFFTRQLALQLVSEGIRPRLICSANVLAHVPDINDFVAGVAELLHGDAVYTVEFPHLLNLISQIQFDTIYHEHYTYLSLFSVEKIFASFGLRVFDVEQLWTHGGSLRVYACLEQASHTEHARVGETRRAEAEAHLNSPAGYAGYDERVQSVRKGLLDFLHEAKKSGKVVAAYGAAAKGNTLLNYCQVDTNLIDFCVDRNPAKQGTLLPGSRIPVHDVSHLRSHRPDYVLILPWNFREEIMLQLDDLKQAGTQFVTPVPELRLWS